MVSNIIRGRIGFDGLLLTDDIDMEALDGSVPDRAARAIAAGCDLVLNCWAKMDDMVAIAGRLSAVGPATAARLERALGLGASDPDPARQAALIDKRDRLLALA